MPQAVPLQSLYCSYPPLKVEPMPGGPKPPVKDQEIRLHTIYRQNASIFTHPHLASVPVQPSGRLQEYTCAPHTHTCRHRHAQLAIAECCKRAKPVARGDHQRASVGRPREVRDGREMQAAEYAQQAPCLRGTFGWMGDSPDFPISINSWVYI